jgi:hypothetical protein
MQFRKIFWREVIYGRNMKMLPLIINQRRLIQSQILNINNCIHLHIRRQIQTEGIVTNLFKNLERSISNWFQFFTLSFKPLFANVKPNFVSNLETVINTMLVMYFLVLVLALFQLFLYYLMHQLNLFSELLFSINVIMTINRNILPKDKI